MVYWIYPPHTEMAQRQWLRKEGDCLGYSGHKHYKGEKTVAFVDRNCNVLSPFTTAPGNRHETKMFVDSFSHLKRILKMLGESLSGMIVSLDSAYDSIENRKKIFNAGMIPNIKENPMNRKTKKRGRKRIYNEAIFEERFSTVERVFAWEDVFLDKAAGFLYKKSGILTEKHSQQSKNFIKFLASLNLRMS
jgi:Transposase DDE domain